MVQTENTAYFKEPMDTLNEPWVRKIYLCFTSQTGKSQVAFNFMLCVIDQDSGPAMYVIPDEKTARRIRLYDICHFHFHITYASANGADIMELATRVGHVNADMIARVYAHLARDIRKETAHKLPKIAPARPNSRQTVDNKALNNKKGLHS